MSTEDRLYDACNEIGELEAELEALRAAVRSAYEAFATIEKAILDFPRGGCYCEPEVNYSCEWCDFLDKLSPTLKTLKPFLDAKFIATKTYQNGLEAASEHLLRLAERTDAGSTQGIGVALVRAAREILELGKGEL